ncbi:hypothetical protein [Lutibacter flavus]|uniref:Outer membrane protein beta-barrel domain-containing protein n=1 Tax=Lutibacter flavus TaxID=691689 RepID=A0A238YPQ7_9FLAO|nr:hypothetical protein [Lutibacter flavus]SNR73117.1 hypothetical protein SAMN04488111_2717 [Lutibacter flavus]
MNKFILGFLFLNSLVAFSQRDVNYNFTVNTTFTTNDHFGEYDEYTNEVDWSLIVPRAIILRNGLDIKLNNFISTGINLGFDWHPDLNVLAIPYFLDAKFTLVQVDYDKLYVGAGIGKLLKIGKAFEKGKYYKIGAGYHISTEKQHSFILNLDFQQKKIADFENGRLNSFSVGFGMIFL